MNKINGLRFFVLEDEIGGGGLDRPPRSTILRILSRHEVTIALNTEDAKKKFDPRVGYTHLMLDFDFHGFPDHSSPPITDSGYGFCLWLTKFRLPVPAPKILLHSQNSFGRGMMRKLLAAAGYKDILEMSYSKALLDYLSQNFA